MIQAKAKSVIFTKSTNLTCPTSTILYLLFNDLGGDMDDLQQHTRYIIQDMYQMQYPKKVHHPKIKVHVPVVQ